MPAPTRGNRRPIRLKDYDYSTPGAYFVTICTHRRQPILRSSQLRQIIEDTWSRLPEGFPNLELDAFVVMPHHVHFVAMLHARDGVGAALGPPAQGAPRRAPTLGDIVRAFKSIAARQTNQLRDSPGEPVWQRNYYDRIVRDEEELGRIREYIANNPLAGHSHAADDLVQAWTAL